MKNKMWIRLFAEISVVFLVFVALLGIANTALLPSYYTAKEKKHMAAVAKKIDDVDLYSSNAGRDLSSILSNTNYSLRIFDSFGNSLFTTYDAPVADYKGEYEANALPDNNVTSKGFFREKRNNKAFLRYSTQLSGGETLVLGIQQSLLKSSAEVANEFIIIVALGCLAFTILWVFVLSKRIAKPIGNMTEIATDMARLDFSRKLNVKGEDEIAKLAAAINELSGTLDITLKDLESKNRKLMGEIEAERKLDKMRKGFVANVSHELKTPLSIIGGYAEGLKLGLDSREETEQYADVIIDETSRMNELVISLLDLSRLESGQISINSERYDIAEQVREFLNRMSSAFQSKNATVECKLPERLFVFADSARIAQVISNYLSNAASHIKDGGTLKIWSEIDNDTVKISVFNTGNVIKKEDMQHVWESFWRGEQSHKRDKDRFGLGLSIVRAITERHGSECGVYNLGDGVVFWFSVKLAKKAE